MKTFVCDGLNAVKLNKVAAVLKQEEGFLVILDSGSSCHVSDICGKKILAHLN